MKITTKTTKEQLKTFLGLNAKAVQTKDKDLFDRLVYADKMLKKDESKVQRADLVSLAKDVMKLLGDECKEPKSMKETKETPVETPTEAPVEPKAENSVKKLTKGSKKKAEDTPKESSESDQTATETPAETKTEEKVDEKKSAKKSSLGKKKEQPKKDGATDSNGTVQKDIFPDTLKVGDTTYKLAHDIKTMDDLYNALEKEEEIVFAFYWTKTLLKKWGYFNNLLGTPKSFENDLDLATTIYVSEEKKIAYHISMYTEGCYNNIPDDFEEVEGIRYAGASEFQIYRAV